MFLKTWRSYWTYFNILSIPSIPRCCSKLSDKKWRLRFTNVRDGLVLLQASSWNGFACQNSLFQFCQNSGVPTGHFPESQVIRKYYFSICNSPEPILPLTENLCAAQNNRSCGFRGMWPYLCKRLTGYLCAANVLSIRAQRTAFPMLSRRRSCGQLSGAV